MQKYYNTIRYIFLRSMFNIVISHNNKIKPTKYSKIFSPHASLVPTHATGLITSTYEKWRHKLHSL